MRSLVVPTYFMVQEPIAKVLDLFVQANIPMAEISADAPASHVRLTDAEALKDLAETFQRLPVQAYSIHAPYDDISQEDELERNRAVQTHISILEAGAVLGVHHVVLHASHVMPHSEPLTVRMAAAKDSLHRLAQCAHSLGIRLALENLGVFPEGVYLPDLPQLQELVADLAPEVVGVCIDTGHANVGPHSPADFVRALGERVIALHLSDNYGIRDDHIFPGAGGTVPWEEFFAALDEVGYALPITMESTLPKGMSLAEGARLSRDALAENRAPILLPAFLEH